MLFPSSEVTWSLALGDVVPIPTSPLNEFILILTFALSRIQKFPPPSVFVFPVEIRFQFVPPELVLLSVSQVPPPFDPLTDATEASSPVIVRGIPGLGELPIPNAPVK